MYAGLQDIFTFNREGNIRDNGYDPMALSGGNINRCLLYFMSFVFSICIIFCIFQRCGSLVAEGHKLYGREPEVEFVTHVTHGGSVKFLPVV